MDKNSNLTFKKPKELLKFENALPVGFSVVIMEGIYCDCVLFLGDCFISIFHGDRFVQADKKIRLQNFYFLELCLQNFLFLSDTKSNPCSCS